MVEHTGEAEASTDTEFQGEAGGQLDGNWWDSMWGVLPDVSSCASSACANLSPGSGQRVVT